MECGVKTHGQDESMNMAGSYTPLVSIVNDHPYIKPCIVKPMRYIKHRKIIKSNINIIVM